MPRYWIRYTVTNARRSSEHTRTLDTEFPGIRQRYRGAAKDPGGRARPRQHRDPDHLA